MKQVFVSNLLNTKMGSIFNIFVMWQKLPDIKAERLRENSLVMLDLLENFCRRKLIKSFDSLYE